MNKKQKQLMVATVATVGILTAGYFVYQTQAKQNTFALLSQENTAYTLELGQAFPTDASVFIDKENTSESMLTADKKIEFTYTEDQLVDTYPKVGTYEGKVVINNKEQTFKMNVVDTTAPTLSLTQESVELDYAFDLTNYDWQQYIQIQDLSETTVTVETNVDTSKAGSYTVKYTVKDASGNEQTIELAVTVKEEIVVQQTTKPSASNKKPTTSKPSRKPSANTSTSNNTNTSGGLKPGYSGTYENVGEAWNDGLGSSFNESDWIPIP